MKIIFLIILINLFQYSILKSQNIDSENFIKNLMLTRPEYFSEIIDNSEKYRVQIIYTQIDRDSIGFPHLTEYSYRLNDLEYYYTASMIKLPVIAMTLEKLNQIEEIDKYTKVTFEKTTCQNAFYTDTTSENDNITFAHLIKKALILSNNDAFNRMYDFLGQEYCNKRLWELGYSSARVIKRFAACSATENKITPVINFYNNLDELIYTQPSIKCDTNILCQHKLAEIGKGVYDEETKQIVYKPKDFNTMNYISLQDLHKIVETIYFPEIFADNEKFNLTPEDLNLIRKYMGMYPRESKNPYYVPYSKYYDSYVKYFLLGNSTEKVPENIRIFDKVGMSFGFMTDVAYIVDYEANIEFFLSAVIYTNENEIINDGTYEYRQTALPFFEQLGFLILDYEKNRLKTHTSDLIKIDFTNGN